MIGRASTDETGFSCACTLLVDLVRFGSFVGFVEKQRHSHSFTCTFHSFIHNTTHTQVRLQSPVGFWKAGGFRGIYNGLGAAAAGSAPSAALFFATYETCKDLLSSLSPQHLHRHGSDPSSFSTQSLTHMMAASVGEVAACLVRVPTEVVKAKMQTSSTKLPLWQAIGTVWQEGTAAAAATSSQGRFHALAPLTHGLYRGFGMTLFREIPFAMIQFPLYEQFKLSWQDVQHGTPVSPFQAAACGSLSGAIAGAITTPLDVLKTRTQVGGNHYQWAREGREAACIITAHLLRTHLRFRFPPFVFDFIFDKVGRRSRRHSLSRHTRCLAPYGARRWTPSLVAWLATARLVDFHWWLCLFWCLRNIARLGRTLLVVGVADVETVLLFCSYSVLFTILLWLSKSKKCIDK